MRKQATTNSNRSIPGQYMPGYVPSKGRRYVAYAEMLLFAVAFVILFTIIVQAGGARL